MKDFIGNELQIGDMVAVTRKPYHSLMKRYVVGFTPKGVRVSKIKDGVQEAGTMPYMSDYIVKIQKYEK